ncbi:MAG: hypothetical protein AB7O96_05770 [Pseudobdellovibrionaceae bacterium]
MKFLGLALMAILMSACTSLNTVSLTSIPSNRTNKITAEGSRTIFLGFNFDNDFVDRMNDDLKNQCPNGMVSGILTKDEVVNYFLMIVYKHRVTATGFCMKPNQAKNDFAKKRNPSSGNVNDDFSDEM